MTPVTLLGYVVIKKLKNLKSFLVGQIRYIATMPRGRVVVSGHLRSRSASSNKFKQNLGPLDF
jgi:hypothetical protein